MMMMMMMIKIWWKSDKNNKKVKKYSNWERLAKLELTTLQERRLKGDLNETFKIINEIFNYGRFFFIFLLELENLLPQLLDFLLIQ